MKVVILAGGLGTRISEESHLKPKPMIEIGGKPMLWHIMKIYSYYGINDFVICLGYKGYIIKEYFANYFLHMSDVTFDMRTNKMEVHHKHAEPWKVTLVDTGEHSMTGGRLKRIKDYVNNETFCFTYGDGVADINIERLLQHHKFSGKMATVTAIQPPGRYGALNIDNGLVKNFQEKPAGDGSWINGGFFVLEPSIFELLEDDKTSFEGQPLINLAKQGNMSAYKHYGFWQAMDTLRDKNQLEDLWQSRNATMESMVMMLFNDFFRGRKVLITGHTGFKGSWLTLWLRRLGADITGISLLPQTQPNLFSLLNIESLCQHHVCDIRDQPALASLINEAKPEIVFHLAAQPLVRASYREPIKTFSTNVMGTANLLETLRSTATVKSVVMVTTDKVYQNQEVERPYQEDDRLGGHDPYSASKAASELVIDCYRNSFLAEQSIALASARAGNVIGGGDWSDDRLIPDAIRAWQNKQPLNIRRPEAIRPWQHVLEPLFGYMKLAHELYQQPELAGAFNFGPKAREAATVRHVISSAQQIYSSGDVIWHDVPEGVHEAGLLTLDTTKSHAMLNIRSLWDLNETLNRTINWYSKHEYGTTAQALCEADIAAYEALL